MTAKTLSIFGHLMNFLNISTADLANAIHVDASLVSKWKSGSRKISEKSVYFEDIIQYLLDNDAPYDYVNLRSELVALFPDYSLDEPEDLTLLLRQALCGKKASLAVRDQQIFNARGNAISTFSFIDLCGKREALEKLLSFAEEMTVPSQLTFLDSTDFDWLADDPDFTGRFIRRISQLLNKGFQCRFIIHYDASLEAFRDFFSMCNILIFQSNIDWYYLPYYNQPVFQISLSLLGHAISTISLASNMQNASTTLFTDSTLVLKHAGMTEDILKQCTRLFESCPPAAFAKTFHQLEQYRMRGIFYNFLSSPAFLAVNPGLLSEILTSNHLSQSEIDRVLEANAEIRLATQDYFDVSSLIPNPVIFFFRLDEMISRITKESFVSQSLSLFCGREIIVPADCYARQIRAMANALRKYPNMSIVLSTAEDKSNLPDIDCWYMQHAWIFQMDQKGYRLCNDPGIVNMLSDFLARYIKNIPESRKNRESVRYYLLDLADRLTAEK